MDYICLVQDRSKRWSVVNVVLILRASQKAGNILNIKRLIASQE